MGCASAHFELEAAAQRFQGEVAHSAHGGAARPTLLPVLACIIRFTHARAAKDAPLLPVKKRCAGIEVEAREALSAAWFACAPTASAMSIGHLEILILGRRRRDLPAECADAVFWLY